MAISGDWLAVGADLDDEKAVDAGAVYLYQLVGSTWSFFDKLTSSQSAPGARFGYSLAMDGEWLLVGVPTQDKGFVEIFRLNAGAWTHDQTLAPNGGLAGDQFGNGLDIAGDRLAVGSPAWGSGNAFYGAVEVYEWNAAADDWHFDARITGPDADTRYMGRSVAIDGDTMVAGAHADRLTGLNGGAFYVFRRENNQWSLVQRSAPAETLPGDWAGWAVDISGDELAVSATRHQLWTGDRGAVFLFQDHHQPYSLFGAGDGSVADCPCGNNSLPDSQQGCTNSTSLGAILVPGGTTDLAQDDLVLTGHNMLPNKAAILLGAAAPDPAGRVVWGPGLGAIGGWSIGQTIYLQAWYRDPPGPCKTTYNVSSGVEITLQ